MERSIRACGLGALFVLSFFASESYGQNEMVEREISSVMQEYGAIGVSVAVVKDNEIFYTQSFGFKNIEDSIYLSTSDYFRIASISKLFVSTAIMQLVEKGKLSLADDINQYLDFKVRNPEYPDIPITIKMLLCHRSSINDTQKWDSLDRINPQRNSDYVKCFNNIRPDSMFVYCNMNYNLLGAIIEKVTHKRFDRYIQKEIINPLRLHGSFNRFDIDSSKFVNSYWYNRERNTYYLAKNVYQPLKKKKKGYSLGYNTTDYAPPAGMIITAKELAQFMIMQMNGGLFGKRHIISNESVRKMREIPIQNNNYALAITHYNNIIKGEILLGHTGAQFGFHTAMFFNPEKKHGFVVFCNGCKSKSVDGNELNFEIIRRVYKYMLTD